MPSDRSQDSFDFGTVEGRRIVGAFDGGQITSHGGGLLLGACNRAIRLIERLARHFQDGRDPDVLLHSVPVLLGARIFGIALGHEDINEHDHSAARSGAAGVGGQAHGQTLFAGRHLLAAKLRTADKDAADGAKEEIARIVAHIRARWPEVEIILRADSGFARDDLMAWCEENGVDYIFGLTSNERLVKAIRRELACVRRTSRRTKQAARRFKILKDWETLESWSLPRRGIAKAEWTQDAANPRFLVTSLNWTNDARYLYEDLYCARGDMENRIKECQTDMFAGRTSAASIRANQMRLWFQPSPTCCSARCAVSG